MFLCACNEPQPNNTVTEKTKSETVKHKPLSDAQLTKVKHIHQTFSEVYPISLEDTVNNFTKDKNPDNKIKEWSHMADHYEAFASKNTEKDDLSRRKEAFKLLLLRNSLSEEETIKRAKLKNLKASEAKQLLENF